MPALPAADDRLADRVASDVRRRGARLGRRPADDRRGPLEQVFVAVYDVAPTDESALDGWEQADSGLYRKTKVRVSTHDRRARRVDLRPRRLRGRPALRASPSACSPTPPRPPTPPTTTSPPCAAGRAARPGCDPRHRLSRSAGASLGDVLVAEPVDSLGSQQPGPRPRLQSATLEAPAARSKYARGREASATASGGVPEHARRQVEASDAAELVVQSAGRACRARDASRSVAARPGSPAPADLTELADGRSGLHELPVLGRSVCDGEYWPAPASLMLTIAAVDDQRAVALDAGRPCAPRPCRSAIRRRTPSRRRRLAARSVRDRRTGARSGHAGRPGDDDALELPGRSTTGVATTSTQPPTWYESRRRSWPRSSSPPGPTGRVRACGAATHQAYAVPSRAVQA